MSTAASVACDENNWARDLSVMIAEKTQAKLNAANLNGQLNGKKASESAVVEATVQVQTNVVLAQRADIRRGRSLVVALLQELERDNDSKNAASLAVRASTMKVLADALKTLVGLERQAFNIADQPVPKPEPPAETLDPLKGLAETKAAFQRALEDAAADSPRRSP